MRHLPMAALSAAVLTLSAGAFPAAAATSTQVTGDASHRRTATESTVCRTEYISGGWDVQPCNTLVSSTFDGWAFVGQYPSTCAGYRVYLVDAATGALVQSTSLRPCGESLSPDVYADASRFTKLKAFTRFKAFNSSGGAILSLDSPALTYG